MKTYLQYKGSRRHIVYLGPAWLLLVILVVVIAVAVVAGLNGVKWSPGVRLPIPDNLLSQLRSAQVLDLDLVR